MKFRLRKMGLMENGLILLVLLVFLAMADVVFAAPTPAQPNLEEPLAREKKLKEIFKVLDTNKDKLPEGCKFDQLQLDKETGIKVTLSKPCDDCEGNLEVASVQLDSLKDPAGAQSRTVRAIDKFAGKSFGHYRYEQQTLKVAKTPEEAAERDIAGFYKQGIPSPALDHIEGIRDFEIRYTQNSQKILFISIGQRDGYRELSRVTCKLPSFQLP